MEHLKAAIKQVQPSEIESYQELTEKFQRLVLSSAKSDDLGDQLGSSKTDGLRDQPCSRRSYWKSFWYAFPDLLTFLFSEHGLLFFVPIGVTSQLTGNTPVHLGNNLPSLM